MEKPKTRQQTKRFNRPRHYPGELLKTLSGLRPQFKDEKPGHQHHLAQMVWEVGSDKRKLHSVHADAVSIGHTELDGKFGKGRFAKVNERVQLFLRLDEHFRIDGRQGYTAGLRLLPDVVAAVNNMAKQVNRGRIRVRLVNSTDGRELKTIPPAVGSKDSHNQTIDGWTGAKMPKAVKIDMMRLRMVIAHFVREKAARNLDLFADNNPDDIDRLLVMANKMLVTASSNIAHGELIHLYEQSESGRLYSFGINLQNCQRLLRQVALVGLWDYDIANCHYAIFQQMAKPERVDTPAISAYLADKKGTRQGIAARVGITAEQAKECLLMFMYGASSSTGREENAIPEAVGMEAAKRLLADPVFSAIAADIRTGRTAILKVAKVTSGRGGKVITNLKGLTISIDATTAQKLAHLIQGVEAQMLDLISQRYPDDVQVFQHDGFVSLHRLDVADIQQMIFDRTGYHITLEEKLIDIPADLNKPRGI